MFRQEVSANTINLHYTLQNPSEYGIFDAPVTYGSFAGDTLSALAALENCQAVLWRFPYDSLSKENQLTYDVLNDYLNTSKEGARYLLYEDPLSPVTGIQGQLPVLLAEYQFHDRQDIDTYLDLLCTTPQYFNSLIEFELEKSEKGLFPADEIVDSVIKQCESFLSLGHTNYLYSTFEKRMLDLDCISEEEKKQYIRQNQHALTDSFFPAYRKLITALSEMRGKVPELSGVCSLPNGKHYYEYLVRRETGSSRSIRELKALIKKQMKADASAMGRLISDSQKAVQTSAAPKLNLKDNSPDAFLTDLKTKTSKVFPKTPDVNTRIKYVPKALEPYLSPAFYLIPCIDNTSENVIYINRSHNMETLNLYTTLAHEGYPGHLYRTVYYSELQNNPLRSLLNYGGYVEGWATYAEMCSYYLSPLPKKEAAFAQKNSSLILGLYASADIGINYDHWDLSDTINFFAEYGIKDKKTVSDIYRLIASDPANYLKYYIGYVEFLELKKEMMSAKGNHFSHKAFHKAVLDIGPAPFDIVRKYISNAG